MLQGGYERTVDSSHQLTRALIVRHNSLGPIHSRTVSFHWQRRLATTMTVGSRLNCYWVG